MKILDYLFVLLSFFLICNGIEAQRKNKSSSKAKVVTGITKGGYDYKLFKKGNGDMVTSGDIVYFDIMILHKDSILQDSKLIPNQPELTFPVESLMEVPNPVFDAIGLMRPLDSILIYEKIDTFSDLPPTMLGWKTITYRIVVKNVITEKDKNILRGREAGIEIMLKEHIANYKLNKLPELKRTASGLSYLTHSEGKGSQIKAGDAIKINYLGLTTADSLKFDSSYERGAPLTITIGTGLVIPGWDEALLLLKRGTKATLFIPADLAYGEEGIPDYIPSNAELAFYIEIAE
ncbi:MAG: FKBP-type peptidyl-prolyl cis-trans isomerase [Saprospiraceae bacterium]|nr:FKBP-type peptidyl-prolyl cis-trans isomerase [Candidatus Brachybacter algidus]